MKNESELKSQVILRLNENTPKIEKCLGLLLEKEVRQKPNANSNSIGNLIIHLCGRTLLLPYRTNIFFHQTFKRQGPGIL